MPANTTPIFIKQGNFTPARIVTANTLADGTGVLYPVVTATADGTRVDGVRFWNSGTAASAKVFRVFISDNLGANFKLIGEVAVGAVTRSTTAIGQTAIYTFDQPIIMKLGQIMSVCQSVGAVAAEYTDATAYAGDY